MMRVNVFPQKRQLSGQNTSVALDRRCREARPRDWHLVARAPKWAKVHFLDSRNILIGQKLSLPARVHARGVSRTIGSENVGLVGRGEAFSPSRKSLR
jgi:hypothetical protein